MAEDWKPGSNVLRFLPSYCAIRLARRLLRHECQTKRDLALVRRSDGVNGLISIGVIIACALVLVAWCFQHR
jgi:hypothetical protein